MFDVLFFFHSVFHVMPLLDQSLTAVYSDSNLKGGRLADRGW